MRPIPTPIDPSVMYDPMDQQKRASTVLETLGMHPNQEGARDLLGMHFNGPTASDAMDKHVPVAEAAPPLISTGAPSASAPPPAATPPMTLPGPSGSSAPLIKTSQDQTSAAQTELNRLINSGSGISHIKSPFLRGAAEVGDTVGRALFPGIDRAIPGTESRHNHLINIQEGRINSAQNQEGKQAANAMEEQRTQDLENAPEKNTELSTWLKQNPTTPIAEYWKQRAAAQNLKLTPDEQFLKGETDSVENGGQGKTIQEAYTELQKQKASGKPLSGAGQKQELEALLAKAIPEGSLDPKVMNDTVALGHFISNSPNLVPEEKAKLLSHFVFNTSPAAQGHVAELRTWAMMNNRLIPSISTNTGQLGFTTPGEEIRHPGQTIPATQGGQSMTKESVFQDLHYNVGQVREAINGLDNGFDTKTRAQVALALRSPNIHSSFDAFLNSTTGQALSPHQIDYITALASMMENANAMRAVQGLGQGSDELRAAIARALPGPGTPNADFAKRQLDLFEGTVHRLEQGVPGTGIKPKDSPPTPKTGEGGKFVFQVPGTDKSYTFTTQKALDEFKAEIGQHK